MSSTQAARQYDAPRGPQAQATVRKEIQRKAWTDQLRAAKIGDVVVYAVGGHRIALAISERWEYGKQGGLIGSSVQLIGASMQFGSDGNAYRFSLDGSINLNELPTDLVALTVVPL